MRNFILTAVLFLIAGVASAAVVYDEVFDYDDNDNKIKIGEDVYYDASSQYFLHESRNPGEEGYLGETYGKVKVYFSSEGDSNLKYYLLSNFNRDSWSSEYLKPGENIIYLPSYSYGRVGWVSNIALAVGPGEPVISAPNMALYLSGSPELFYHEGRNTIVFDDGQGNKAKVTFGEPLPTPVITLLIALGFGAAFVMYRNRKQARA